MDYTSLQMAQDAECFYYDTALGSHSIQLHLLLKFVGGRSGALWDGFLVRAEERPSIISRDIARSMRWWMDEVREASLAVMRSGCFQGWRRNKEGRLSKLEIDGFYPMSDLDFDHESVAGFLS